MPQTFYVLLRIQASTHTHTQKHTPFGSGLRNSDCSSILSSAGLSRWPHPSPAGPNKDAIIHSHIQSVYLYMVISLRWYFLPLSTFISFSISLYYIVSLGCSLYLCVCVLGRVKRLIDRKYSSSENSSLACMCSLKWKQHRSLTNIWMRPANHTQNQKHAVNPSYINTRSPSNWHIFNEP